MRKLIVSFIFTFATTLSIPALGDSLDSSPVDTRFSRTRGFERPADNDRLLLPALLYTLGLPAPTCADISYYSDQRPLRYPGEIKLTGSGAWVCRDGVGAMFGDPRWLPTALEGRIGTVTTEIFDQVFDECYKLVADGGCTFSAGVSSENSSTDATTFISVPIAPALSTNPIASGGLPIGCKFNSDCGSGLICVQNECIPSAPPTAPPPI